MAEVPGCRDAGIDCDFMARGETAEEILEQCAGHGREAHGMTEILKGPGGEDPVAHPRRGGLTAGDRIRMQRNRPGRGTDPRRVPKKKRE